MVQSQKRVWKKDAPMREGRGQDLAGSPPSGYSLKRVKSFSNVEKTSVADKERTPDVSLDRTERGSEISFGSSGVGCEGEGVTSKIGRRGSKKREGTSRVTM